jgi:hypothetical protein
LEANLNSIQIGALPAILRGILFQKDFSFSGNNCHAALVWMLSDEKTIKCVTWIFGRFIPKIIFNLPGINPIRARSGELNKLKPYEKR